MARPIPEYKLPRPLTATEAARRRAAWSTLLAFTEAEGVDEFESLEHMTVGHGVFYGRTPSFDWSVEGRCFAAGYEYDKDDK